MGCKDDDPKPFKPIVSLQINHTWNDSSLVLNQPYYWKHDFKTDTIIPTTLIYHINHLTLNTQDNQKIDADLPYYMVDYGDKKIMPNNISFTAPRDGVKYYITSLEFTIGIADSLANATGALNSIFVAPMYWGMIQGYINFKFDALSPQLPSNVLMYHIGGYTKPYYNFRRIKVDFDKPYYLNEANSLTISCDILKLFNSKYKIDLTTTHQVETVNEDSKIIADNMAEMFKFDNIK